MRLKQRLLLGVAATVVAASASFGATADWTRFGGPDGNFTVAAADLATSWGEDGPRELWRIEFGEHGHSTLLVQGDRVYALARRGDEDVLAAFNADSGAKVWETAVASPLPEGYNNQFGPGPHATPLIVGDRIFTVSSTHVYRAFNTADGKELWSVALKDALGVQQMRRGYGASPVAWKDTIIVVGGGEGQGVLSLKTEFRRGRVEGTQWRRLLIATHHRDRRSASGGCSARSIESGS